MDTLIPWKVWGRYEDANTVGYDDHQAAHVDFGSITYKYKQGGKADGDLVQRKFVLQEVLLDDGDRVVIEAKETMSGAQPWEFTFRNEPKLGSGVYHWILSHNSTNKDIKKKLPMTEKYWILRFGMWPVLGVNVVLWGALLILLWYNFS
jgi:hypothetical protein